MRLAVVLDDTALQSQGPEGFTHHAQVRRVTEAQLQERAPAKVNPLIQATAPDNGSHTDEAHDDGDAHPNFRFPDKIDVHSRRN